MEKSSCHSTADSTTSSTGSSGKDNNNNNNNPYLKHLSLNKLSHKISKPPSFARSALDPNSNPAAGTSTNSGVASEFNPIGRPIAPLSPLPPMPAVYAAAESPVSAYMRYLQSTASGDSSRPLLFSGFPPMAPPATVPPPASASAAPPPSPPFQLPLSPLPFGCLNSPRSPHPLLSPGLLFLPTSGQLGFPQFPLSPTVPVPVPVPSPTYKGGI
ncbi:hypothetical protein CRG98_044595 [Punica granatum]|uniref:Uncharacterized protein n=1 Tax=Punica granatum TaxID=22663 RepID=A0A2I0HU54_PUNGR|nr:hypothetical protein CRG98_044595 [Punica granatum]